MPRRREEYISLKRINVYKFQGMRLQIKFKEKGRSFMWHNTSNDPDSHKKTIHRAMNGKLYEEVVGGMRGMGIGLLVPSISSCLY